MSDDDFKDFLNRHSRELVSNFNLTDEVLLSLKAAILDDYAYFSLKVVNNIVQRAIAFHDILYNNPYRSRSKIPSLISVFDYHERQGVVAVFEQWVIPEEGQVFEAVKEESASFSSVHDYDPRQGVVAGFQQCATPGKGQVPEAVKEESASFSSVFPNFDLTAVSIEMIDRKNELALIKKVLDEKRAPSGARVVILAGMGGAGKTTLAKLYAKKIKKYFQNLIWIDAEQEEEVIRTFKKIQNPGVNLENMDISIEESDIEYVYKLLLKSETLLIFDNVELPSIIYKYLPKAVPATVSPPTIIITTRVWRDWEDLGELVISVGGCSMDDCLNYIREGLAKSPREIPDVESNGERLVDYFGGLAIALQAAVRSIVEQNKLHKKAGKHVYTIANFLEDVSKIGIVEEFVDPGDPTKLLKQLWTKTLNVLTAGENGETCEKILYLLAFFGPNGVRENWFYHLFEKDCEAQVMYGIDELTAWSLANATEDNMVIMDRLLQETIVTRIQSDQEKSSMFFKWLEGATRRLTKHLRVHDRRKLRDLKFCLGALCEQLNCGNIDEAAVKFCANMVMARSEPVLSHWKVHVCSRTYSAFDVYEFISRFFDKLCGNIEAGVARVSPGTLSLVTKASRFEGHRLIPMWLEECSSLPWTEKICFVTSVLSTDSYKCTYNMELVERIQLSVSISKVLTDFLHETHANLVRTNTLHGIQALVEFLWWEHLRFVTELAKEPSDRSEIDRSTLQVFENVGNIVKKLTEGILASGCQDFSKLSSLLDILIKWQNFFTKESVEQLQLPLVEEEVQNLKQGCFLNIQFPVGRYNPLQQALSNLYALPHAATVSKEQLEFEARILVIFTTSLDSLDGLGLDVKWSSIFSTLMSFVHNTNEFYKILEGSALPLMMFFSSLEVIFLNLPEGSSLDSLVICDSDAFLTFKIETLMQLLQELCSSCFETRFFAPEEESWQLVLCVLEPLLPNIRRVFRSIIDIFKNSSVGVRWKTIYHLELEISKFGYERSKVFKTLKSCLDQIKDMNTFLPIIEQIVGAAERESTFKKNTINEGDYLCSCYHLPYQLLLVGCYDSVGKFEKAAEKAVQVCQHCVECNLKPDDDVMTFMEKIIAKVEHEEIQQKYKEKVALLRLQLVQLEERTCNKHELERGDILTVQLYCIQGKLSEAVERLDKIIGFGWIKSNQSFDLLARCSLTLTFQLLFNKDYQATQRLSDKIYNESMKYPSFTQNYQYLIKTVRALAMWKAKGTEFPLKGLEDESEPAVGEFEDFFDTSIKWCIRVRQILRSKGQSTATEIPSFFEWMSDVGQTMEEPSAYLLYFRALEDMLQLQNKSSGRKLEQIGYLEELKKTISLNYYDADCSDWEFSISCLIRAYHRGDLND